MHQKRPDHDEIVVDYHHEILPGAGFSSDLRVRSAPPESVPQLRGQRSLQALLEKFSQSLQNRHSKDFGTAS